VTAAEIACNSREERALFEVMEFATVTYPKDVLPAGTAAQYFTLRATPDQSLLLSELRGRPVVLVFYPADWSPVCNDELAIFNELLPEFEPHDA
jgi:thiol-disulfide isomerase/thioredoxin